MVNITFTHEQLVFDKEGNPMYIPLKDVGKVDKKGRVKRKVKLVCLTETAKLCGVTLSNLTVESLINALNEVL